MFTFELGKSQVASLALCAALAFACGGKSDRDPRGEPTRDPDPPDAGSVIEEELCKAPGQRLVRLTFPQIVRAVGALLGDELGETLARTYDIDPEAQGLPPLNSIGEGTVYIESNWTRADAIAQDAGKFVLENFARVTGCESPATDDCARGFVASLAERAFRRPPTAPELESLLQVLTEARSAAINASVEQSVQYGVYAVLSAPQFLYRTEFGEPGASASELALTPYELASQLAFFVAGGPPDQPLLDAARDGALGTAELVAPHVERLLASDAARRSLGDVVLAMIGAPRVRLVVIDSAAAADFNSELAGAMLLETRAFVHARLWDGPLGELLTSRRSRVNAELAALYGVPFPPPGAVLDADGFADVELPEARAGLLTQVGMLTGQSRPDSHSVIARGLWVNSSFVGTELQPFPEDPSLILEGMEEELRLLADAPERDKVAFRIENARCATCHVDIDPYGLALENFDVIGRYRSADAKGRPIDPSTVLPSGAGGRAVADAAQLGAALVESGTFARRLTEQLLAYALAERRYATDEARRCSVERIRRDLEAAGDDSFAGLVRQIALSAALSTRSTGADP